MGMIVATARPSDATTTMVRTSPRLKRPRPSANTPGFSPGAKTRSNHNAQDNQSYRISPLHCQKKDQTSVAHCARCTGRLHARRRGVNSFGAAGCSLQPCSRGERSTILARTSAKKYSSMQKIKGTAGCVGVNAEVQSTSPCLPSRIVTPLSPSCRR